MIGEKTQKSHINVVTKIVFPKHRDSQKGPRTWRGDDERFAKSIMNRKENLGVPMHKPGARYDRFGDLVKILLIAWGSKHFLALCWDCSVNETAFLENRQASRHKHTTSYSMFMRGVEKKKNSYWSYQVFVHLSWRNTLI